MSSAWEIPDFENVETFINRLVRADILVYDPVVKEVLQGHPPAIASRTVRHRFLRAALAARVASAFFNFPGSPKVMV